MQLVACFLQGKWTIQWFSLTCFYTIFWQVFSVKDAIHLQKWVWRYSSFWTTSSSCDFEWITLTLLFRPRLRKREGVNKLLLTWILASCTVSIVSWKNTEALVSPGVDVNGNDLTFVCVKLSCCWCSPSITLAFLAVFLVLLLSHGFVFLTTLVPYTVLIIVLFLLFINDWFPLHPLPLLFLVFVDVLASASMTHML